MRTSSRPRRVHTSEISGPWYRWVAVELADSLDHCREAESATGLQDLGRRIGTVMESPPNLSAARSLRANTDLHAKTHFSTKRTVGHVTVSQSARTVFQ